MKRRFETQGSTGTSFRSVCRILHFFDVCGLVLVVVNVAATAAVGGDAALAKDTTFKRVGESLDLSVCWQEDVVDFFKR